jgi:hypothetical protein
MGVHVYVSSVRFVFDPEDWEKMTEEQKQKNEEHENDALKWLGTKGYNVSFSNDFDPVHKKRASVLVSTMVLEHHFHRIESIKGDLRRALENAGTEKGIHFPYKPEEDYYPHE